VVAASLLSAKSHSLSCDLKDGGVGWREGAREL